jgi:hypothetical protein
MSLLTRTIIAFAASSFVTTAALGQPFDLQGGGNGPDKVLSATLGIKGPKTTVCPNEATVMGWVETNFAGPVTIMIARKGQGVGAPVVIQAKAAPGGRYMATYTKKVPILAAADAEYRLLAVDEGSAGVVSNWVRLKATCAIGLPGFDIAPGG